MDNEQQLIMREDPAKRRLYFEGDELNYDNETGYFWDDRPGELQGVEFWQDTILPKLLDNVKTKDNILEIGCAAGYHSRLLADHFDKVLSLIHISEPTRPY